MASEETQTENVEVAPAPAPVPSVDPLVKQLVNMAELLDVLSKTSKSLTVDMKALTKDVNKLRLSSKSGKKVKKEIDPNVPRKLGALEKPVPITDELAEFLRLDVGELYSRQKITQTINAFIKSHDLQNPENRRYILLESEQGLRLKKLLRDPDQALTFFNIQRYLKVHYPKVDSPGVEASAVPAVPAVPAKAALQDEAKVVSDVAVVDETPLDLPVKKKVVRRVVKKAVSVPVTA